MCIKFKLQYLLFKEILIGLSLAFYIATDYIKKKNIPYQNNQIAFTVYLSKPVPVSREQNNWQ